MVVHVDLPPEAESTFVAEAESLGLPLEQVLRQHLLEASERSAAGQKRAQAMQQMFADFDKIVGHRKGPPLSEVAFDRENLYPPFDDEEESAAPR